MGIRGGGGPAGLLHRPRRSSSSPRDVELHVTLGWILHLLPILILLAAALARAGRTRILQATALAVTVFIVPILATLRADAPVLAALHPVGALLAFWLAIVVARGATSLVGANDDVTPAAVAPIGG